MINIKKKYKKLKNIDLKIQNLISDLPRQFFMQKLWIHTSTK